MLFCIRQRCTNLASAITSASGSPDFPSRGSVSENPAPGEGGYSRESPGTGDPFLLTFSGDASRGLLLLISDCLLPVSSDPFPGTLFSPSSPDNLSSNVLLKLLLPLKAAFFSSDSITCFASPESSSIPVISRICRSSVSGDMAPRE